MFRLHHSEFNVPSTVSRPQLQVFITQLNRRNISYRRGRSLIAGVLDLLGNGATRRRQVPRDSICTVDGPNLGEGRDEGPRQRQCLAALSTSTEQYRASRQVMRTATPSTTDESFLVFGLSDRAYAIPISYVAEIAPMAELSQVPGSPNFLSGFLNVAGQLIGVVSLRRLFGLPDRERHLYSPLVLLKTLPQPIALEVDTGLQIARIRSDEMMPLDEASSVNNCATAVVRIDGSSVVVLSVDQLLLEQERKRVAELAHLAGQRLDHMDLVTA